MKSIIYYYSFLGSSRKYAKWLAEEIGAELYLLRDFKEEQITNVDNIIVTSGTYAGQMPLNRFLQSHWGSFAAKKVFVLAVGAAPADDEQSKKAFEVIPEEIRKAIKYYKVPGRLFGLNKDKVYKEQLVGILAELR